MSEFKNLTESEHRAVRVSQKRSAWKDIKSWVEALSKERSEHAATSRAFDMYVEEKDREVNRLQRRIDELEGKKRQDEIMEVYENLDSDRFEDHDKLLDAHTEHSKTAA